MERSSEIEQPSIHILLVLVTVFFGFAIIGPAIGIVVALPFYEGSITDFMAAVSSPIGHPEIKLPFFIIQGCATFFGLIVAPGLLLVAKKKSLKSFFSIPSSKQSLYLITVIVTIAFMLVNSPFIEWNASVYLPEFLKGFEEWARTREDFATEVTEFLTTFDGTGQLLIGIFVIAVLPAIGEEFVFRGLLQPQLHKSTGNIHIAIWVSAFLFSAMHMQFFGLVPRMLLGGLFGYLYYWSGNLWIAMLAHFVNNGFAVTMLYFHQQGVSELDMNSTESAPWGLVVGASVVTFILLYFFKQQSTTTELGGTSEIQ
jgi:uncharacterized protein